MAVGPIPWTAIATWAEFHELDREFAMMLVTVIRQLDVDRAERAEAKRALEEQARARRVPRR